MPPAVWSAPKEHTLAPTPTVPGGRGDLVQLRDQFTRLCAVAFGVPHGLLVEGGAAATAGRSAGWPGRDACLRRAGAGAWLKRLAWVKPSTKLRDTMWA